MAKMLKNFGFEVDFKKNCNQEEMSAEQIVFAAVKFIVDFYFILGDNGAIP